MARAPTFIRQACRNFPVKKVDLISDGEEGFAGRGPTSM